MPNPGFSSGGLARLTLLWLAAILPLRNLASPLSCASRSKNSDHNSASDSLLDTPPVGLVRPKSEFNAGVLGVRRNGEIGTLNVPLDVPGRARPACSRCSNVEIQSDIYIYMYMYINGKLTFCPSKKRCYKLENLELLGITPIERKEM